VCYRGTILLYGSGVKKGRRRSARTRLNSRGRWAGRTVLAQVQTPPRGREDADQPERHSIDENNNDHDLIDSDNLASTSGPA